METGGVKISTGGVAIVVGALFLAAFMVMAFRGNTAAIVVLAVLAAILLIGVGAGLVSVVIELSARRQQANFVDNARENLAIMTAMQRIQNMQTQNVMRQLPSGPGQTGGLAIDDDLFHVLNEPAMKLLEGNRE